VIQYQFHRSLKDT